MKKKVLKNSSMIALAIETLTGERPADDYPGIPDDVAITDLELIHLSSMFYPEMLGNILMNCRDGVIELATLVKYISSEQWLGHACIAGIDDCADYYGMNAGKIREDIRRAIDQAKRCGLKPQAEKPDEALYLTLAKTVFRSQLNDPDVRYPVLIYSCFIDPEKVTTRSDLCCYYFSLEYVTDHITGDDQSNFTTSLKHSAGLSLTRDKLSRFLKRQSPDLDYRHPAKVFSEIVETATCSGAGVPEFSDYI